MNRKKADGTAFEKDFSSEVSKKYYVKRLHTSFTPNPSDFIVLGNRFNYVEVKETAADSFSIASMQQLSEMIQYAKDKEKYKNTLLAVSRYWIVVNFIKHGVIKVVEADTALVLLEKRQTLKPSTDCDTYSSLKQLTEGGLF